MTSARLANGVYIVSGRQFGDPGNAYLMETKNGFVLIDTGGEEEPIGLMRNLLTLLREKGKLEYVILTSCVKESAAGANYLATALGAKIVIHEDDAPQLRKGRCLNAEYPSASPFIVIRGKENLINDLKVTKSGTPTPGSIIIRKNEYVFTGATELTILDSKVKYIFGLYGYERR
ncbi:MBL fold metallo-hydrolase [Metallosphaera hakonensis]|uniref:Metallo-beta-lactamase domain-containing protein n=1 Tax=Metallosphaera hakonensis JCM 8857 = DSM 7519 TaxID=1293036 RepID=A0A2U9ITY7_9CREN|nr:MBL fold metallo-hydrolase [Metallosphaera hakonensis]AWR99488.1 MBL fold metallo-hydrolase [Metallosphaera hakonensis JCM 8857 = DSM 7519]